MHDGMVETGLVTATWVLVVATFLLVVTASIPLIRDIADRRDRQRSIGARLVPDMAILRERLADACIRLADSRSLSVDAIREQLGRVDKEADLIYQIIQDGSRPSLIFANEAYLVRHLLTQARIELETALRLTGKTSVKDIRARDDALLRARRLYKAALDSLGAAEEALPPKARTINGESFQDRFSRLSGEREAEARRSLDEKT